MKIDVKQVAKINRLAVLLQELKSDNFEKEYKLVYELGREVFN